MYYNGLPVVFVDNMTGSRFVWSDAKEEIRLSESDVFLVAEGVYMSHLSAFSGICHDPLGSEKGPDIIEPADALTGYSDIERISLKKRRAYEEAERKFQGLQSIPGIKPAPMDPLNILEDDEPIK